MTMAPEARQRPVAAPELAEDWLQAHPIATILIDQQHRIADVNQAAELLLNRARGHLIGKAAADVIGWRGQQGLLHLLDEPAASARLYSVDIALAGGRELCADIILSPAHPDLGARQLALNPVPRAARLATPRPGAAARSAAAAAAMLAHEIKNPLSGIRGAAQLLGKQTGASGMPLADLICGEVDRIAALIDSMQGFTRDAPLRREALNVYPAIGQAREIASAGFADAVRFEERFDPSIPLISGNHDALVQILINLIKNAAEAAGNHPDSCVRIATNYRHGFGWDSGDGRGHVALPVELAVMDNGPGVPPPLVEALFDPFVSGKRDGQGLGLALVDKLMRDMGGIIQHDRIEGWTRFRLHFPLSGEGQP